RDGGPRRTTPERPRHIAAVRRASGRRSVPRRRQRCRPDRVRPVRRRARSRPRRALAARPRPDVAHGTCVVRWTAMSSGTALEHETSTGGRWLRQHRVRTALWIAVLEVVLAAVTASVSKYTIIVIGLITIPVYLIWGKDQRGTIRQVSWIAAAAQA